MNSKNTKRALVSSALAMLVCVAMLVGTTFAWFTDTASTSVNKIQSGSLDVDIVDANNVHIDTLNFIKAEGGKDEAILWEPGCTYNLTPFKIVNNGTLAHKYKAITFSNVKWEQFDKISNHPSGAEFNEPKVHIIACEEKIEFHGYNISAMNEGVRYTIEDNDAFELECDLNTSTISPHPGGHLEINLGIISAQLNEHGGNILLDNVVVATVPSQFHLKMSLMNGGDYEIEVDGHCVGHKYCKSKGKIDVIFAFLHDSHYCSQLSHAYIYDISMMKCIGSLSDSRHTVRFG